MSSPSSRRGSAAQKLSAALERVARPIWLNDRLALVADKVGLTAAYRLVQRRIHPPEIRDLDICGERVKFWITTPNEDYAEGDVTITLFDRMLAPGQVVLDVGAHHGYFTLLSSIRVGPEGKVLAFEPDPGHTQVLTQNVEANGRRNVTVVPVALGATPGQVPFYGNRVQGSRRARTVDMKRLDDVVAAHGLDRVDVLKIDVEGHEYAVLQGASETLKKRPRVFMELHPPLLAGLGHHWREPIEILLSHGYRLQLMEGASPEAVPYEGQILSDTSLYQIIGEPA